MADPTIVHVPLGERAYDIVIGAGLYAGAGARLAAQFPGFRIDEGAPARAQNEVGLA
jgi:3-dehydroquinate synthase